MQSERQLTIPGRTSHSEQESMQEVQRHDKNIRTTRLARLHDQRSPKRELGLTACLRDINTNLTSFVVLTLAASTAPLAGTLQVRSHTLVRVWGCVSSNHIPVGQPAKQLQPHVTRPQFSGSGCPGLPEVGCILLSMRTIPLHDLHGNVYHHITVFALLQ